MLTFATVLLGGKYIYLLWVWAACEVSFCSSNFWWSESEVLLLSVCGHRWHLQWKPRSSLSDSHRCASVRFSIHLFSFFLALSVLRYLTLLSKVRICILCFTFYRWFNSFLFIVFYLYCRELIVNVFSLKY